MTDRSEWRVLPSTSEVRPKIECFLLSRRPVPFVANVLRTELSNGIYMPFDGLAKTGFVGQNVESHILTQAVRRIDRTGVIPHLLGVSHDPQETISDLMHAVHFALFELYKKGEDTTKITLRALLEDGPCTAKTLGILGEMWGIVVGRVKATASEKGVAEPVAEPDYPYPATRQARDFRQINVNSLSALKGIYGISDLTRRAPVVDSGDQLVGITEQLTIPVIPDVQVEELLRIVPDIFNTKKNIPGRNLEEKVLQELGKAGSDVIRDINAVLGPLEVASQWKDHLR